MKKLLFTMMALMATLSTQADDYPYLTFEQQDGTVQSVPTTGLTLTLDNGKLVVNSGAQSFALTDLKKMYFSKSDATPIERPTVSPTDKAGQGVWYTLDGRMLSGQPTQKGIYVNNGRKVIIK